MNVQHQYTICVLINSMFSWPQTSTISISFNHQNTKRCHSVSCYMLLWLMIVYNLHFKNQFTGLGSNENMIMLWWLWKIDNLTHCALVRFLECSPKQYNENNSLISSCIKLKAKLSITIHPVVWRDRTCGSNFSWMKILMKAVFFWF